MKIESSLRTLFNHHTQRYELLQLEVDKAFKKLLDGEEEWLHRERLKKQESFVQKVYSGRYNDINNPEDFLGYKLIVPRLSDLNRAESKVRKVFSVIERRPESKSVVTFGPSSFEFDDLRLYIEWRTDSIRRPTGLEGMRFEIQLVTILQHAWSVATHDFSYKGPAVSWPRERMSSQLRAVLENTEIGISEIEALSKTSSLQKQHKLYSDKNKILTLLKKRWNRNNLPKDLVRLSGNISELLRLGNLSIPAFEKLLDEDVKSGEVSLTTVSPFAATVSVVLRHRHKQVISQMSSAHPNYKIHFPIELDNVDLELLHPIIERIVVIPQIPTAKPL